MRIIHRKKGKENQERKKARKKERQKERKTDRQTDRERERGGESAGESCLAIYGLPTPGFCQRGSRSWKNCPQSCCSSQMGRPRVAATSTTLYMVGIYIYIYIHTYIYTHRYVD